MYSLTEYFTILNQIAPMSLSEKMILRGDYDNSGILIKCHERVEKVLFSLDLSEEVDKLRAEIIEFGNYKEEVDAQSQKEINGYKSEISELKTQLKVKESSYDKLSNENGKTISDLRKQVAKLEEKLEKESNKGLFNRFK